MKIGIFTNNYLPNPYGVAGSIESFRRELESLGHKVFIFAPKWKGYLDENKNVFRYPSLNINLKFKFPLAIPYSRKLDKIISEFGKCNRMLFKTHTVAFFEVCKIGP